MYVFVYVYLKCTLTVSVYHYVDCTSPFLLAMHCILLHYIQHFSGMAMKQTGKI